MNQKYTDAEIQEKKQYYLSLKPVNEKVMPLNRWLYEVKRVFELNKSFREDPEKWFAHLDRFRKIEK